MSDPDPRLDDILSAHLDGEATAVQGARIESDPALTARLAELAAVRDAIRADPPTVDDVTRECDLCEQHPGECDGLSWTDVQARWPNPPLWDPDHRRVPGSETFNEM